MVFPVSNRGARVAALLGCASAIAMAGSGSASAQSIVRNGGDVVVNETSASGTPAAIIVTATNADIEVDTVTGNNSGATGNIVFINTTGSINATFGSIEGSGTGQSRGILAVAQGTSTITVDEVRTNFVGIFSASQSTDITVTSGGTVSADVAGIAVSNVSQGFRDFASITNNGTITAGTAITTFPSNAGLVPNVFIYNNGTLTGTSGSAVFTGNGDDTFESTENGIINGWIDLGDGDDRYTVENNSGSDAIVDLAQSFNVERLSVESGAWIAQINNSYYEVVEVESGARLIVAEISGFAGVAAPLFELDGRLDLQFDTSAPFDFLADSDFVGSGSIHLTGPATVRIEDASGLQHTGGTFIEDGTLELAAAYGGDIATSGSGTFTLAAGGDFTGNLVNDGTFVFNRGDADYLFGGAFSGTGSLIKNGAGTLTFGGVYAFTGTTTINAGAVVIGNFIDPETEVELTEDGTFDVSGVSGGEATIAELGGSGGTLVLGSSELTVDQDTDTVFGGTITGDGIFIKDGDGNLNLTGNSLFSGEADVTGGILSVNGDYSSASFVASEGGTLGGTGTLGDTSIEGGALAPGNSIGTMTIDGDLTFTAASVYEVEVDAAGNSDRTIVNGTATLGGASVEVTAEAGEYALATDYTILTADTLNGTFGSVATNFAYLDPSLSYTDNDVVLRLLRNDVALADYTETPNQAGLAGLVETLGAGDPVYEAAIFLAEDEAPAAFETLTGEVYAGFGGLIIETVDLIERQARLPMSASGEEGFSLWATGLGGWIEADDGAGGYTSLDSSMLGALAGVAFASGEFALSLGGGRIGLDSDTAQYDDATLDLLIGQISYGEALSLNVRAGAIIGWSDADVTRDAMIGALEETLSGKLEGDVQHYFAEAGYGMSLSEFYTLAPYVGIRRSELNFDEVIETGGHAALAIAASERGVTFLDAGVRIASSATGNIAPYLSASLRHAWGDIESTADVGFASSTGDFTVAAIPLARNSAQVSAGFGWRTSSVSFTLGYDGSFSSTYDSHGISAGISIAF